MYILATDENGNEQYLNAAQYQRFSVTATAVEAWTPDNLCLNLKKTKELKAQLDALCSITTKGFEKFS